MKDINADAVATGHRRPGKGRLQRAGNSRSSSSRRRRRRGSEPARPRRMPRSTPTPLARPRPSGRRGSPPQTQHQVHPETPPASPAPLKGGKKKKKSQGAKLPKKFPRGERTAEQGEQSLKGASSLYRIFSKKTIPTAQQTTQHKSHKLSLWCRLSPYT